MFTFDVILRKGNQLITVSLEIQKSSFSTSLKEAYRTYHKFIENNYPDWYIAGCYQSECLSPDDYYTGFAHPN